MAKETPLSGISRRNFLRAAAGSAGLAAAGLGPSIEAFAAAQDTAEAERAKNVRQLDSDPFEVKPHYKRYNSMHYAFNSVGRDAGVPWKAASNKAAVENVLAGMAGKGIKVPNIGMARVYAGVGSALWSPCGFFNRTGQGTENMGSQSWSDVSTIPGLRREARAPDITDPVPLTRYTKTLARLSGADVVGVAPFDIRWIYTHTQRNQYMPGEPKLKEIQVADVPAPKETDEALLIPADVQSVVVMTFSMNRVMMQTSPSPVGDGMAGMGYLRMGISSLAVAEFIRTQGYWAIPSTNCVGMNVPIAIQAGLGEAGRHGMLITPEFGPNIRIAKVFTNMPMTKDKPIAFGVQDFCLSCLKCARECPSKSIAEGPRTWEALDECNNPGVHKWYNNYKKCLFFWMENGFTCGNCLAVCPFTKGDMWAHAATEWAIANMPFLNGIWLGMDDAFGYGERRDPSVVWDMPITTYGLDLEQTKKLKNSF